MASTTPHVILANPSEEERLRCWEGSHPLWGAALTLDGYIGREKRQLEIPLARNGGLTNWILTEVEGPQGFVAAQGPNGSRPVLSSCETLKKRALVRTEDGSIREGTAHGVASVFTDPEFRGRGYASAMMRELANTLHNMERETAGDALFSVLYSDIGPEFYSKAGWLPHASNHVEFTASTDEPVSPDALQIIHFDDLPPLVAADEQLIRREIANPPEGQTPGIRVAILPDLDQIHWHLAREGFVCDQLFSRRPTAHGALYTTPSGGRAWAIWARSFSGTVDQPDKNTLYILRFVVEEGVKDGQLREALAAIVAVARKQAADWACASVQMWNPEEKVKSAAESLGAKYEVRLKGSIASLHTFSDHPRENVEWLFNEKYAWC